jgi:hypothetical protein
VIPGRKASADLRRVPRTGSRIALLIAATALAAVTTGAASARPQGRSAGSTGAVSASFEGSLDGWGGNNAHLSLANDGVVGRYSARVALRGAAGDFSIYAWPMQVDSTIRRSGYAGDAWIRSDIPGRKLCLRMREWTQDLRKQVRSAQTCVKATTSWRAFPSVRLTAKASSDRLDLYVYEAPARKGDSFEVDGVTVTPDAVASPPPVPPAGGNRGIFANSSILTTPIPADPALSPDSDAQVASMVAAAEAKGWALGNREWNATVFHADASTPLRTVRYVNYSSGAPQPWYGYSYTQIRIPDGARPTPDGDHKMVIVDDTSGCVYDLGGHVEQSGDGSWTATAANGQEINGSGVFPSGNSASASGFSYAAGMVTPQEIAAEQINHALTFSGPMFNGSGVFPATGSDAAAQGTMPEGARVQLDPTLDLDDPALGLTPWQKTIARALQVYGMYGIDWGGAFAITDESADSGDGTYPWEGSPFGYLPTELAKHLQALAYGPQFANTYTYVPTRCNTLYS